MHFLAPTTQKTTNINFISNLRLGEWIHQPLRIQALEFLTLDGAIKWTRMWAVWQLSLISISIFPDGEGWTWRDRCGVFRPLLFVILLEKCSKVNWRLNVIV